MIKNIIIVVCGVMLAAVVFTSLKIYDFYTAIYRPSIAAGSVKKSIPVKPKTDYNILVLGYGGPGHDGPYLTDTMMVMHIDLVKKHATFVSVPRDIWVSLPTKSGAPFHAKVNSLYETEKFPESFPDVVPTGLVQNTIEHITGLTIDNYIGIDFSGFEKALDVLDGVDINVQTAFTDREYPVDGHEADTCGKDMNDPDVQKQATESPTLIFPCRYETLHFDAGMQHMDGARALKYVRSRHGDFDNSDFGRAARQQHLIEALKARIISIDFIPKISPLLDELKNHISMDITTSELQTFMGEIVHLKEYKVDHLVMSDNDYLDFSTSEDGESILVPKKGVDQWADVRTWIGNEIAGITPTPTKASVTPTPTPSKK